MFTQAFPLYNSKTALKGQKHKTLSTAQGRKKKNLSPEGAKAKHKLQDHPCLVLLRVIFCANVAEIGKNGFKFKSKQKFKLRLILQLKLLWYWLRQVREFA